MLAYREAVVKLVIAIIALATVVLPSARGQVSLPCCGMPTYTVTGIKVGTAPDGSQYKTALWIINGASGDWSYSRTATVDPVTGQPVMTTSVSAAGGDISGAGWNGGPNQHGAHRLIVSGYPDNTVAVQTLNVQIWSAAGYAITALVGHLDASGNLLEPPVALTDPQLLVPRISTQFTLGLDDPSAMEVAVRNTGSAIANVTLKAYDSSPSSTNRVPFATATVQIPAGGKFCHLISEIFGSFADAQNQMAFANDYAGPDGGNGTGFVQGVLALSADQPISVNAVLFNTKSDGSLLTTVWYAFSSAPSVLLCSRGSTCVSRGVF